MADLRDPVVGLVRQAMDLVPEAKRALRLSHQPEQEGGMGPDLHRSVDDEAPGAASMRDEGMIPRQRLQPGPRAFQPSQMRFEDRVEPAPVGNRLPAPAADGKSPEAVENPE